MFGKKLQFYFINKVVRLKLGQNLPNYARYLLNTVCQKGVKSCAHKKLYVNVDEIDH
jgi:hypothetical protein